MARTSSKVSRPSIWDHEFLMGSGIKARSKLSPEFARLAFRVLLQEERVSNKDFVEKICAPLKLVEVWDKSKRKRAGTVCSFPATNGRSA